MSSNAKDFDVTGTLQVLFGYFSCYRYFSGTFQVLFMYLPHLNKLTKSHIHEKAKETFVLSIKKDWDDSGCGECIRFFLQNTSGSLGTFQVST